MKHKEERSIFMQWLLPFGMLLCIIIIMLMDFAQTSKKNAEIEVAETMKENAKSNARLFADDISELTNVGKPMGYLMSQYQSEDIQMEINLAKTICENTDAYQVVFANLEGYGVTQDGFRVNLRHEKYIENGNFTKPGYAYTECDFISEKQAIVSIIPIQGINKNSLLLLYYPADEFETMFEPKCQMDSSFFLLVEGDGTIAKKVGNGSSFMDQPNFYDALYQSNLKYSQVQKIKTAMGKNVTGISMVVKNGREVSVTYTPIGIDNMYLVEGISGKMVWVNEQRGWQSTKEIVRRLIIAICVFFGLITLINIMNRRNFNMHRKKLETKADTDLLTGLYNKIATEREIKNYMKQHPNRRGLLFILDIDNFKKINDTMGHAFGDEVLQAIGAKLKVHFRQSDIVGRTGGDELTIFLKNMPDEETLYREAGDIADIFADFIVGEYVRYKITASIGVSMFPQDGSDFRSMYESADAALYLAKRRGKNQMAFYNEKYKKGTSSLDEELIG